MVSYIATQTVSLQNYNASFCGFTTHNPEPILGGTVQALYFIENVLLLNATIFQKGELDIQSENDLFLYKTIGDQCRI